MSGTCSVLTGDLPLKLTFTGEVEFLDVWHQSYAAVMRYSRAPNGFWVCHLFSLPKLLIVLNFAKVQECQYLFRRGLVFHYRLSVRILARSTGFGWGHRERD